MHAKTKRGDGALDIAVQNDKLELLERLVHCGLTAGELGEVRSWPPLLNGSFARLLLGNEGAR